MIEDPGQKLVEMFLRLVKDCLATSTGTRLRLNNLEHSGCRLPGLLLHLGRLAANGERAGVIGMITAEPDTEVENHQLARLDLPIAWCTAARIRTKVLPKVGWRLADHMHRD